MAGNGAVFFLSTGRCGTQWIGKMLAEVYNDLAVVRHEPLKAGYQPKKFLRAYHGLHCVLENPMVSEHLQFIKNTLPNQVYVEAGWPCYPAIPLFLEKLDEAKVVHIVRHPVSTALSLATHNVYSRRDWVSEAAITPFDRGVTHKDDWLHWEDISMYEKCLFWWTEINAYALDLRRIFGDKRFHFVRFEDLFSEDNSALEELVHFIGLPYRHVLKGLKRERVDAFRYKTESVDWRLIYKYPGTLALMERFGYEISDDNKKALSRRYFSGFGEIVYRSVAKMKARVSWLRGISRTL